MKNGKLLGSFEKYIYISQGIFLSEILLSYSIFANKLVVTVTHPSKQSCSIIGRIRKRIRGRRKERERGRRRIEVGGEENRFNFRCARYIPITTTLNPYGYVLRGRERARDTRFRWHGSISQRERERIFASFNIDCDFHRRAINRNRDLLYPRLGSIR